MTQYNKYLSLLVILLLIVPNATFAQPVSNGEPGGVPVDGGLSLLVAAGVGYSAKKMKEKRVTGKSSTKKL